MLHDTDAILIKETRGHLTKLSTPIGKRSGADQLSHLRTAARSAWEQTGGELSAQACRDIEMGERIEGLTWHQPTKRTVAVHVLASAEAHDLQTNARHGLNCTRGTTQRGVTRVPIENLLNEAWRAQHMHWLAGHVVARAKDRVEAYLQKLQATTRPTSRQRCEQLLSDMAHIDELQHLTDAQKGERTSELLTAAFPEGNLDDI